MDLLVSRFARRWVWLVVVVAAAALGFALFAGPAQAQFPGANGKIGFERSDYSPHAFSNGIWTVDPDGGNLSLLIPDSLPAWSADGTKIAFASTGGSWVASADGGNATFLTDGYDATWAPDGSKLAFTRNNAKDVRQLWVVNVDGTNPRLLRNGEAFDPSWSPDGTKIAYDAQGPTGAGQIWVVDADGRNPRLVAAPGFGADAPDWSPDGSSIAFESNHRIGIVDSDGSNVRFLEARRPDGQQVYVYRPVWSPDGTAFAFMAPLTNSALSDRIWISRTDGTNAVQVTNSPGEEFNDYPAWQPRPVIASPFSTVFQARPDHTESSRRAVTLTNHTGASVNVTGVALAGTDPLSFLADRDTCTGQALADGASCTVQVRFRPLGSGAKTAKLQFTDNGPGNPQTVALSGTATPGPWLQLSAQALKFGHWRLGTTAAPQSVTLTNIGTAGMRVTAITIDGANPSDFPGPIQNCLGITNLAPGHSCTAGATFHPTATGTRSASLSITDNAPRSPQRVTLYGTGT
jgi:hypothetical protein